MDELSEECLVIILSRTTPVDAARLSVVSKTFCSAVDSDDVWHHFLPSDYHSIISQSPNSLSSAPSKKALYLSLSNHHVIIDGRMNFQLERKCGNKCFMLGARALYIRCGRCYDDDGGRFWRWISVPNSRFPQVAWLRYVWWFEIRGMINTHYSLSPNTHYAAFLVFDMTDAIGFLDCPVKLSVSIAGGHNITKTVCLDSNLDSKQRPHERVVGLQRPSVRSDGLLEIEMGEFFNKGLQYEQVQLSVIDRTTFNPKGDFSLK